MAFFMFTTLLVCIVYRFLLDDVLYIVEIPLRLKNAAV